MRTAQVQSRLRTRSNLLLVIWLPLAQQYKVHPRGDVGPGLGSFSGFWIGPVQPPGPHLFPCLSRQIAVQAGPVGLRTGPQRKGRQQRDTKLNNE